MSIKTVEQLEAEVQAYEKFAKRVEEFHDELCHGTDEQVGTAGTLYNMQYDLKKNLK